MNEFKRDVYYFRGKLFRKQSFIAGYPDGHGAVHGAVSCGIVVGGSANFLNNLRACLIKMEVPSGDRFCCEKDVLSVLKRKEKGRLYGETERNRCIQTGPEL